MFWNKKSEEDIVLEKLECSIVGLLNFTKIKHIKEIKYLCVHPTLYKNMHKSTLIHPLINFIEGRSYLVVNDIKFKIQLVTYMSDEGYCFVF